MNPKCPHCQHVNSVTQPLEATSGDLLCCSKCGKWFAISVGGAKAADADGAKLGNQFESLDLDALDKSDAVVGPANPVSTRDRQTKPAPVDQPKSTTAKTLGPQSQTPASQTIPRQFPDQKQAAPTPPVKPTAIKPQPQSVVPPQPPVFVPPTPPPDLNTTGHRSNQPPMDVNQLDFSDPLESITDDGLKPLQNIDPLPLEILDDPDLFRDMEVDKPSELRPPTAPNSDLFDRDELGEVRAAPSMLSVRCRVCDTLQYVETKPGSTIECEICSTTIQLADAQKQQAGKRGRWTAPNRAEQVKNTSPESFGELAQASSIDDAEVLDLIRDVEESTIPPAVTPVTAPLAKGTAGTKRESLDDDRCTDELPDSNDDLNLAPLDDDSTVDRLSLLALDSETKSLLEQLEAPLELTDPEALVPLDESDVPTPPTAKETPRESPPQSTPQPPDKFSPRLTAPHSVPTSTEKRSPVAKPAELSESKRDEVVEDLVLESLEALEPLEALDAENSAEVDLPWESATRRGPQVPPPFVTPPVATPGESHSANSKSSTGGSTNSGSDARSPSSRKVEPKFSVGKAWDRKSVDYDAWKQAFLEPLTSAPLWLSSFGMLLVMYWLNVSWLFTSPDNTLVVRLLGYVSGLIAFFVCIPTWLALLGVVANRTSSLGLPGRLRPGAIAIQGSQFAIVLLGAIPGMVVGAVTFSTAVTLFMASLTLLPTGLYFVTSAIVAQQVFCYNSPLVLRSMKELAGEWSVAAVISGMILTLGLPVAILLHFLPWIGALLGPLFVVPASLAYAISLGRLAKRISELGDSA